MVVSYLQDVEQLEAHAALLQIMKFVQSQHFADDISRLKGHRKVFHELRKLSPFLDSNGILRVGGRIVYSVLFYEARHPALGQINIVLLIF